MKDRSGAIADSIIRVNISAIFDHASSPFRGTMKSFNDVLAINEYRIAADPAITCAPTSFTDPAYDLGVKCKIESLIGNKRRFRKWYRFV